MQAGTLVRQVLWETPTCKQIAIKSSRLVSFKYRHLAAISCEVTVLNAEAPVEIDCFKDGKLSFNPQLPIELNRLQFSITI